MFSSSAFSSNAFSPSAFDLQAPPPSGFVIPINRTVEWDELKTPSLVVGDTFWHAATLLHALGSVFYGLQSATSIKVAVVKLDHSMVYCDSVELSSATDGADYSAGVISILMPESVTQQIASHVSKEELAKIEIEVEIASHSFTWFAPVKLIPGFIK